MASVLGLLEAREAVARERLEELQQEAERIAAEAVVERLVVSRRTVAEVLAGPDEPGRDAVVSDPAAASVGSTAVVAKEVVPSRMVPHRRDGLSVQVLRVDYRRILAVLESADASGGLRVKQLAAALGLDLVPAKIEGVRSKVKRLVERGWAAQPQPGVFAAAG